MNIPGSLLEFFIVMMLLALAIILILLIASVRLYAYSKRNRKNGRYYY